MTTNNIVATVRRKCLEATGDVLSQDTILEYVNEAYQDVYKRVFPNADITTTTLALTNGAVAVPAGFGTLYGDAVDSAGNRYPEVSIEDFDRQTLGRMVTIEAGELKAYPAATASLTIRYWPRPEALTVGSTPSIDTFFHEPVVYGALARVFEDLQDEELSTVYESKFEKKLSGRIAAQSSYEETNQRGAVMFDHQPLISDGSGFVF